MRRRRLNRALRRREFAANGRMISASFVGRSSATVSRTDGSTWTWTPSQHHLAIVLTKPAQSQQPQINKCRRRSAALASLQSCPQHTSLLRGPRREIVLIIDSSSISVPDDAWRGLIDDARNFIRLSTLCGQTGPQPCTVKSRMFMRVTDVPLIA